MLQRQFAYRAEFTVGAVVAAAVVVSILGVIQAQLGIFWTDVTFFVLLPIGPVTTAFALTMAYLFTAGVIRARSSSREAVSDRQLYLDVALCALLVYFGDTYIAYWRDVGEAGLFWEWMDWRIYGREFQYRLQGGVTGSDDGSFHEFVRAAGLLGVSLWGARQATQP